MDTVVAKIIIGCDENGYFYKHTTHRPDVCPVCKNRIKDVPYLEYNVKKKSHNFLVTHDHYTIVSHQFKKFCEKNKYYGLEFISLSNSTDFYYFDAPPKYKIDLKSINFINHRDCCGEYDEIIVPRFYQAKNIDIKSHDFIYRTEIRFGSYAFKNYCGSI